MQFEMDSHPATYWGTPASVCANIKGQRRRQVIAHAVENGGVSEFNPAYFADSASPVLMTRLRKADPQFGILGEILPDYLVSEVEVARAVLEIDPRDILSLRARRDGGSFRYRVVCEASRNECWRFEYDGGISVTPLALSGVVQRLTQACLVRVNLPELKKTKEEAMGFPLAVLRGRARRVAAVMARVESSFYPMLAEYFESLAPPSGNSVPESPKGE